MPRTVTLNGRRNSIDGTSTDVNVWKNIESQIADKAKEHTRRPRRRNQTSRSDAIESACR